MDPEELAVEMINFMNATGQMGNFLDWAEERGFSRDDLSNDVERIEEAG